MKKLWAACALVFVAALSLELAVRARPFTDEDLEFRDSVTVLDSEGRTLRELATHDGARARWTALGELSPLLARATVAVEDHRFAQHGGVDLHGLARAAWTDLRERRGAQGGSTLSMQLARLIRPHPRTLAGKLGELLDALRLERALTKPQLLEQYLNRAPYGSGALGAEAASERYLGKPAAQLSLAEAALLAGLPNRPSELSPLRNPEAALRRREHVLRRMQETGAASAAEVARALQEPLKLANALPLPLAMHFTEYALAASDEPVIRTALSRDLQAQAERLVRQHVDALGAQGVTNAAAVVLDNQTCRVLALVGSADYWEPHSGAVNGALAYRQPGSALKPFTYALAFERGDTPLTPVADIETRWGPVGKPLFMPKNFNESFAGPVLMGDALGRSLNVPAVRVAASLPHGALLDKLHEAGFALPRGADHYGLGLTLGNGEVTLVELAQAYALFARHGVGCRATPLVAPQPAGARVFSERTAALITGVLSDESLRVQAFGPGNALLLGFPVAVKTGTSSDFHDNWAVGYTERVTVAVWSGDFQNRPLQHLAAAAGAGPLFHKLMKLAAGRAAPLAPSGLAEITVCAASGKQPGRFCPRLRTVRAPIDAAPREACPWHRALFIDKRNGLLAGPGCPQGEERAFEVLPPEFAAWQKDNPGRAPPRRYSPLCPAAGAQQGAVVITWPRPGEVFLLEPGYAPATQTLRLAAEADADVRFMLDGAPLASSDWPLTRGAHVVQAVSGAVRSTPVAFEVR